MLYDNQSALKVRIHPTYAVLYRHRLPFFKNNDGEIIETSRKKSILQQKNEHNLKKNFHNGELSAKAQKRLKNAIGWLVLSARKRTIRSEKTGKNFSFKIAFMTLTLPSLVEYSKDNFVKSKLLNSFFMTLKQRYGGFNYVWKAEAQKNGNIHIHIVADLYVHYSDLRFIWNRILIKNGLMKDYTEKHRKMTKEDYIQEYSAKSDVSAKDLERRYLQGVSDNWENPNTTDIKNTKKVKNLASYLASYFGKKCEDRRIINGKLWGCSQALSERNKCEYANFIGIENSKGEQTFYNDSTLIDTLSEVSTKVVDVLEHNDGRENDKTIASVFFYKFYDVVRYGNSILKELFLRHIEVIRNWEYRNQLNLQYG